MILHGWLRCTWRDIPAYHSLFRLYIQQLLHTRELHSWLYQSHWLLDYRKKSSFERKSLQNLMDHGKELTGPSNLPVSWSSAFSPTRYLFTILLVFFAFLYWKGDNQVDVTLQSMWSIWPFSSYDIGNVATEVNQHFAFKKIAQRVISTPKVLLDSTAPVAGLGTQCWFCLCMVTAWPLLWISCKIFGEYYKFNHYAPFQHLVSMHFHIQAKKAPSSALL